MSLDALAATARERFAALYGRTPRLAVAPGRVNLIGEHTDYNDGFVLPMAIDRHVAVAFAPRDDERLVLHSVEFADSHEYALRDISPPGGSAWHDYVAGVAWALQTSGTKIGGADVLVHGDVPVGAGLSSSAALELASARALVSSGTTPWDAVAMARLGQRAEREYVGVQCGIMDQMASAVCEDGSALLIDCRSLETTPVAIPEQAAVVVMDTGARRSLAGSAYNDRRAACETAVRIIADLDPSVRALRDVDRQLLEAARTRLDDMVYRRALHVVLEAARPIALAAAFAEGDLREAGRLMDASHASLRDLYEVSSAELDLVCDLARANAACYGARMTGAGFGGCAIALVDARAAGEFISSVQPRYEQQSKLRSAFFACRPVAGARLLD